MQLSLRVLKYDNVFGGPGAVNQRRARLIGYSRRIRDSRLLGAATPGAGYSQRQGWGRAKIQLAECRSERNVLIPMRLGAPRVAATGRDGCLRPEPSLVFDATATAIQKNPIS